MRFLLLTLFSVGILSSCQYVMGERVYGDGNIITRDAHVGSFNSIDVSSALEVHISQGNANQVQIKTDQNLLDLIEVFTDGNTLVARIRHGYNLEPSGRIVIQITAPEYKSIQVSGASKIIADNTISANDLHLGASGASQISMEVDGGKISSDLSGASSLSLKGQATDFDLEASGASHSKCYELVAENAMIDLSGASSAEITASKNLRADASGASHVRYKGDASVNSNTSGAGSVRKG
jgi:Putative auto-transporter adhesin, head GIN domain